MVTACSCSPAVSLTRPTCGALPALPVASEKSSAMQNRVKHYSERTTVNCNGDSLQCNPAVSLTRPMCGALPVLPVASEKSSAVQSRAEQCRAERNSEHQKVVSSTHLRSFNIYFVQSFIILFPFCPLLCTKLPSPSSRVAKCKAKQSRTKPHLNWCRTGDAPAKQSSYSLTPHITAAWYCTLPLQRHTAQAYHMAH